MGEKSASTSESAVFYYHPDHLGSTAIVTDVDGRITQNVVYIPFGEVFVEQRDGNWNTPYLFNAKELDEETGLYYFGASYLGPSGAQWLSVDPLFEKYAGMSPYNYCAGNPVKLVDPDGRAMIIAFTGGPLGGGNSVDENSSEAGTTGILVNKTKMVLSSKDINCTSVVITPGATASSSKNTAYDFYKKNHKEGEDIIIYGYSYGGDFAVEFAEKLKDDNVNIRLLITVDASDGPLENTTVNNMIPDNVEYNRNVYQLTKSGHSSYSSGSSAETSGSDSSIFPASHGGANYAENTAKTKVFNHNITSDKITHRNIDESTLDNNVKTIENFVRK